MCVCVCWLNSCELAYEVRLCKRYARALRDHKSPQSVMTIIIPTLLTILTIISMIIILIVIILLLETAACI